MWIDVHQGLPPEEKPVSIRVRGVVRRAYYRIEDRWYGLGDLHRWRMKTSPYWSEDRAWYLETEQVEAWEGPYEPEPVADALQPTDQHAGGHTDVPHGGVSQ